MMDFSCTDLYQSDEEFVSLCKRLMQRDDIHTLVCENCTVIPFLIRLWVDIKGRNEGTSHVVEEECFYQNSASIVYRLVQLFM